MATRLTKDDLRTFTDAANRAEETCQRVNRSTGIWTRAVLRWNATQPHPDISTVVKTQEEAAQTFKGFFESKAHSDKARAELDEGLKPMRLNKKDEYDLIYSLENQLVVINVACDSMQKDLPIAKTALNNLLGWGKDTSATTLVNALFGWTPHVDELSKFDPPSQPQTRSSSAGSKPEARSKPADECKYPKKTDSQNNTSYWNYLNSLSSQSDSEDAD